jgi:FkbM family methyltransferase
MSKAFSKAGYLSLGISRRLHQAPQERILIQWSRDNGDKTHRLQYELDESSVVFDVGGYEGQWASDIFAMFCCTIHVFEPVAEFADRIEKRFSRNKKIIVHKFGLSNETRKAAISVERDASSAFKHGTQLQQIDLVAALEFLQQNNIRSVDLMKINIEGGEYDLFEHLISVGFVRNIKNIQVQFHSFVPDAERRMKNIQRDLTRSHFLTYQYPFVWENWKLKPSS